MNMADALDRARGTSPQREAVICGDTRLSFEQLGDEVSQVAVGLTEAGVVKGDRVCLYMINSAEFLISHYAAMKIGAICVSLSHMLKMDEVTSLVNDCKAKVVITDAALAVNVPAKSEISSVETLVAVGDTPCDVTWEALHAEVPEGFATCHTAPDDPATIIYTSGTTGVSKGVVLTHGNLVSNTNATKYMCGMKGEDRALLFLPMSHSFAQNFIMNSCMQAACTLVVQEGFVPDDVLAAVAAEKITRFYAVPAIYIVLLSRPDAVEAMKSVTYCFSAAASMPEKVAHQWKDAFGLDMHEGYGLTESTPFATYNHEIRHKFGSVGTPIMNVEVQIIGESGKKLPAGEPGEILIRGPNIMKEYFGKPKETKEAVTDGWLHSGDIGYLDDEGYLFLVDRLKDMINNSGFKVWPREVEEVLYHNPKVRECAVIGVPHEIYGETVKAVISIAPGVELTEDEVKSYVKEHLSDYKIPRVVEFMDELPKNATGKIMKRELRG
jgi:long-chain acyl-CoA synthetase